MPFCSQCGTEATSADKFCAGCGTSLASGGSSVSSSPGWQHGAGAPHGGRPLHPLPPPGVWIVIGLLTALGVFVLIPSAILIKDAISSITADALSRAFGLFILEFALVFAAVGAACLAIVWLLFLGDKVG